MDIEAIGKFNASANLKLGNDRRRKSDACPSELGNLNRIKISEVLALYVGVIHTTNPTTGMLNKSYEYFAVPDGIEINSIWAETPFACSCTLPPVMKWNGVPSNGLISILKVP